MQTVHKSQEHFLETTYRHIMRRIVRINRNKKPLKELWSRLEPTEGREVLLLNLRT